MNSSLRFLIFVILFCGLSLSPKLAAAQTSTTASGDEYTHVPASEITVQDRALNFGFVYAIQWTSYIATQESTIREHASLNNMREHITKPHFDKDHLNWNLSKHTLTGNYYYLFYRSRGYNKREAFEWSFWSSMAFEFLIETATERPSYQDMYQTPVFGSIVGMGAETLSLWLHSLQTMPTSLLGYIFNPFTTLKYPYSHYQLGWRPTFINKEHGIALTMGVSL